MTDLQAIDLRHSRRSYLDTPIEVNSVAVLLDTMDNCNKESGLSIQWVDKGREAFRGFSLGYGLFSRVGSYFALIGKTSDSHLKEKAGYYGEQLVLTATKLGLGTCWVGGTFSRNRCPVTIRKDEVLLSLITVGHVAEKKGFKENTIYKLTHRKTKSIEELYSADTSVPQWFVNGMKAVQKAPSAINHQPVFFTYRKGIVTAKVINTKNHEPIDLGIAKLHFEIGVGKGKFELGNDAKWLA